MKRNGVLTGQNHFPLVNGTCYTFCAAPCMLRGNKMFSKLFVATNIKIHPRKGPIRGSNPGPLPP